MAYASRTRARKKNSWSAIWCAPRAAAPARAATPAATRKDSCSTAARRRRARPMTSWMRSAAGRGRHGPPSRERPDEQRGGQRLPRDVGDGGADETQPRRVHQERAEDEAQEAACQDVAHGSPQLLDAAQPAVAGERDREQRRAEPRDAQPLLPRLGDRARAAGEQPGERSGEELEQQYDAESES